MNDDKVHPVYLMNRPLERPDPSLPADLMKRYHQALREHGVSEKEASELTASMLENVISDLSAGGAFDKLLEGEMKDE